ncbi:MAG: DUF4349 domain-containing protein [Clostridiales bacterium]|nr:DUF4349 domain-containing protein [Clostridiales bacterium]
MKKILVLMLSVILVFSLISCGSNENSAEWNMNTAESDDMAYSEEYTTDDVGGVNYSKGMDRNEEASAPEVGTVFESERKIIKSASMEIQTLEYELAIQRLTDKVKAIGGYVESSNVRGRALDDKYSTRSAHYTLRIPEQQFMQFMSDMNSIGTIIQENSYGDDITSQYFDTEAHMKTLKIQEERLLDILRKAEKIEDIITLERELSNIRYQIEGLQGNLKRWDNLVSYSTLTVSIYEVQEIIKVEEPPKTLGQKISQKFTESLEDIKDFFEDLAVFGIGSLPLLIVYLPMLLVAALIIRKIIRIFRPVEVKVEDESDKKNQS